MDKHPNWCLHSEFYVIRCSDSFVHAVSGEIFDPAISNVLDEMFYNIGSWHNMALISTYADPKDVNLCDLFYNGFRDESPTPTKEDSCHILSHVQK